MTGTERRGIDIGPGLTLGVDLSTNQSQDLVLVPVPVHAQKGLSEFSFENYYIVTILRYLVMCCVNGVFLQQKN